MAYEVIYDGNVLMQRLANHLDRYRLNPTSMALLSCLMDSGGNAVRMKELGCRLAMSSGGVTRAVDRLEAEGLIERTGGVEDRREVMVRPTLEARRRVNEALPGYANIIDKHRQEALSRC